MPLLPLSYKPCAFTTQLTACAGAPIAFPPLVPAGGAKHCHPWCQLPGGSTRAYHSTPDTPSTLPSKLCNRPRSLPHTPRTYSCCMPSNRTSHDSDKMSLPGTRTEHNDSRATCLATFLAAVAVLRAQATLLNHGAAFCGYRARPSGRGKGDGSSC